MKTKFFSVWIFAVDGELLDRLSPLTNLSSKRYILLIFVGTTIEKLINKYRHQIAVIYISPIIIRCPFYDTESRIHNLNKQSPPTLHDDVVYHPIMNKHWTTNLAKWPANTYACRHCPSYPNPIHPTTENSLNLISCQYTYISFRSGNPLRNTCSTFAVSSHHTHTSQLTDLTPRRKLYTRLSNALRFTTTTQAITILLQRNHSQPERIIVVGWLAACSLS